SSDRVRDLAPPLAPGEPGLVRPAALEFLDRAAGLLERGYVWLADYGAGPGHPAAGPAVHGYRGQTVEEDVLSDPGSKDITAGVDFGALAGHARDRGLRVWGPATQRDVLLALGFRDWDRAAREHQVELAAARRGVEALR